MDLIQYYSCLHEKGKFGLRDTSTYAMLLQKRLGKGEQYIVMEWTPPFVLGVGPDLLGLPSPSPEERHLSMAETGDCLLYTSDAADEVY